MANISSIKLPDGTTYDIKDSNSGYITGMTILSYGSSTWDDFIEAYNANKIVYCRASSNSNPASGSQTRLAFMAYVNNATTPTNVEFQYYRSVSSHTASQQGDQVFVYKLDKTSGWSVTVREASVKVVAGTGLGGTYSNGTMTLTGPTKVSDLTNDSGFITDYTETDPVFSASAAAGITSSDITSWNDKQAALISGTNIKTINNTSLLGSGNIDIQSGDNIFIAEYDKTTYDEIANAIADGKIIIVSYHNAYGFLTAWGDGEYRFEITRYLQYRRCINHINLFCYMEDEWECIFTDLSTLETKSVTLPLTGWTNNSQSIYVFDVTLINDIVVSPSPSNVEDYINAGIVCIAQSSNSLTFKCNTTPTSDISVNIAILN